MGAVIIRDARPAELDEIGELRVGAYQAGGFLPAGSDYAPHLRHLGADGAGHVLVAVSGERIAGTVMLQPWSAASEIVMSPDEAEVRALAVAADMQGRGVGRALLTAIVERAGREGVTHLTLCTQPGMRAAQRLYEGAGFSRLAERDWSPHPGLTLLAYGLRLDRSARSAAS